VDYNFCWQELAIIDRLLVWVNTALNAGLSLIDKRDVVHFE